MALWEINNVKLRGVAACVPKNVVKSHDLDIFTQEEADTFVSTVGINERRLAPLDVCASDLCVAAGEKLIAELGWDKSEIDILSFASVTGDYKTPPTSCIIQDRLGLTSSCFTLDIPMGCCGCIYSINIVGNMMSTGFAKKAILLIGDTALRMGSMKDKSRVPLFGDGGTALALEYDETADKIVVDFNTLGAGHQALITPHGGFRNPITEKSFEYEDFGNGIVRAPMHTLINGMDVFSFAISKPPKSVKAMLEYCNLDKDADVDYFLIHQANKLIVDRIAKKLKLAPEKVPYNLQNFGNLGGASIPTMMVTNLREQMKSPDKKRLIMTAFGLGLSWGTIYMQADELVVPELVEL